VRARHLIRVWIPKTMRIGYSQRRAVVVVVGGATVDFARRPTTMIIIGIVLALVGLAYLCWLLFALAVYALIVRWRHRWACHLSQRFGADRSDHRRANCQQRHPRPWADRPHDVALAP
jgi:hypothetical protein